MKPSKFLVPPNPYAGFWLRLFAALIDGVLLWGCVAGAHSIFGTPYYWFTVVGLLAVAFGLLNEVLFTARFGGSMGKLIVGIRITDLNFYIINNARAFVRFSVNLTFQLIRIFMIYSALNSIDSSAFLEISEKERFTYVTTQAGSFYHVIDICYNIWVWGEFLTLLANDKSRALHDFLAGTVVIKPAFLKANNREV